MQPVIECCKFHLVLGKTLQEEPRKLLRSQQLLTFRKAGSCSGYSRLLKSNLIKKTSIKINVNIRRIISI